MFFNDYGSETADRLKGLERGGEEAEGEAWRLLGQSIEDMGGCALALDSIEALVGDDGCDNLSFVQDALSMTRRSLFAAYSRARTAYGVLQ